LAAVALAALAAAAMPQSAEARFHSPYDSQLAAAPIKPSPAPTTPTAPLFGFNYATGYYGTVDPATTAKQLVAINPNSVLRLPLNWQTLQPTCTTGTAIGYCGGQPGPINWAFLDPIISTLHASNVRVLGLVLGSPSWAWDKNDCASNCLTRAQQNGGLSVPPADNALVLQQLQAFVTQVVHHYDAMYPGEFVGVEVWNEPNLTDFWVLNSGPDAARYVRLLCAGYQGVRAANSTMPVISAGLANAANTNGNVATANYLANMYAAGAASCMTAIGVHPYPVFNTTPPDDTSSLGMQYDLNVVRYVEFLYNHVGTPIWITEFGYFTPGTYGQYPIDPSTQASYLVRAYQIVSGMNDVKAFIIHTLYDVWGGASPSFGIYADPLHPKPGVASMTTQFRSLTGPST
jgi:hypothetical protein